MRAGALRHKVLLQTFVGTRNTTSGRFDKTEPSDWSTTYTSWSMVEPLSGTELIEAQAIEADVTHKITTRWVSGVTPDMQAVFGTREFGILSVLNTGERNIELVLLCKERI